MWWSHYSCHHSLAMQVSGIDMYFYLIECTIVQQGRYYGFYHVIAKVNED